MSEWNNTNGRKTISRTKRCRNFSDFEKYFLLDLINKTYLDVIENKQCDGVSVRKKKSAWQEIADKYNCKAQTGHRTARQLHYLYDVLRKKTQRKNNNRISNIYKNWAGTFTSGITKFDSSSNHSGASNNSKIIPVEEDESEEYQSLFEVNKEVEDDENDEELKKQKKRILSLEERIKIKQLEMLEVELNQKKQLHHKRMEKINMEINQQQKLYEIELKIKEQQLVKIQLDRN